MGNIKNTYLSPNIRMATVNDAKVLLEIYKPYVVETSITFEYEVPTQEEFANRITQTLHKYPWLVYEEEGEVIGYAYAGAYAAREAYKWSTTLSIYLKKAYHHKGIASILYKELMDLLKKQGFYTAYALITSPNPPSQRFHDKLGFTTMGVFPNIGFKHGEWKDVVYMQKILSEYDMNPQEPKTVDQVI
jgi:phosphinothricin acetyltransferase